MHSTLLISEKIELDKCDNNFVLGKVLNHLKIPTVPFVYNIPILAKLSFIPKEEQLDVIINIKDEMNKVIAKTNRKVVHNIRPEVQTPGIDFSLFIKTVLCKKGNFLVELIVNNEIINRYPFYVTISEDVCT